MRKIRLIGLIVLVGIISLISHGCNSNGNGNAFGEEDKITSQIDKVVDPSIINTESAEVTGGTIYLDISLSMQGYISDPNNNRMPFTLLQHMLHNVLQTSFHHVGISTPAFKCFGGQIMAAKTPMRHFASREGNTSPRSRYNGSETNIVGVFQEASKNPASLSVIITDGSQDVHSVNGMLAPGFDRPEFIQAIGNGLIGKGFGVWLIGIMNDFDGVYYNIIPDRNGEINKPRNVRGKRPVYCWVISKSVNKGREYIQYLYDDITRLAKTNSEDTNGNVVQAIEIAPGIYPEINLVEPKPSYYFKLDNEASKRLTFILDWRDSPKRVLSKIAQSDFPKVPGNNVLFVLQATLEFKLRYNWNSFPSTMWQVDINKTHLLPMTAAAMKPDIKKPDSENLRFVFINIPHDRLVVLNDDERVFEFPVCLYANLDTGLDTSWVKTWSTVIDTEERHIQGKTLYLYEVVSELLAKTIGKKRIGACLSLSLKKRDS